MDEVYCVKVVCIEKFGVFVNFFDKIDVFVYIFEMVWMCINNVEDLVVIGDEVDVKIIKIDEKGCVDVFMKVFFFCFLKFECDEKGEKFERFYCLRYNKDYKFKKEFIEILKDLE